MVVTKNKGSNHCIRNEKIFNIKIFKFIKNELFHGLEE